MYNLLQICLRKYYVLGTKRDRKYFQRVNKASKNLLYVIEFVEFRNSPASVETLNADSSNCADDLVENLKKLNLTEEKRKTALVYDNFMMKHKILSDSSHVEDPHRIKRIYDELKANGLVDQCRMVPSRHATVNEISLVHEVDYIKLLEETSTRSKHDMINFERQFNSVYYCSDSYKCATMAVGSLLNVVDSVVTGKKRNFAFCKLNLPVCLRSNSKWYCCNKTAGSSRRSRLPFRLLFF